MPNSLRTKFNSMRHKGRIDEAEYQALIKKLDGHDSALLDRVAEKLKECSIEIDISILPFTERIVDAKDIDEVIAEMKAGEKSW